METIAKHNGSSSSHEFNPWDERDIVMGHNRLLHAAGWAENKYPYEAGKGYEWKDNDRISRIIEGSAIDLPTSREDAIALVEQRFGCVFPFLQERYQKDTEIEDIAARLSSGHAINRAARLKMGSVMQDPEGEHSDRITASAPTHESHVPVTQS